MPVNMPEEIGSIGFDQIRGEHLGKLTPTLIWYVLEYAPLVIIIPNNEIMLRDIINYTTISEKIRVRINIGIAYDADVQQAKDIILQVAATAKWVSADPPPKVMVRNFGESSLDLQLRVWIADARRRMDTISYITDRIKAAFDEQGIEIPYPKRDIYIRREITLPPAESKTGDTV